MTKTRIFGLMLAFTLLFGAFSITPASAGAYVGCGDLCGGGEGGAIESGTIFYSDDTYTNVVGERGIDCLGRYYRWGTTSAYYEHFQAYC
jgi:hypothetical protein